MGSSDLEHAAAADPETATGGHAASPRQLARIVGTAVAGALTLITIGLVLAMWGLGLTGKISQSTSEVLDLVKLGFALVAGVGGTVGLVLAYQRHLIAVEAGQRERTKESREDGKERREETKLFNERFAAAASQIASEQYAVKLAGVYAMAKLADDWNEGRQTCINVLCANLRRGYAPRPADDAEPAELLAFKDGEEFRHAIIAVITTRLRDEANSWQGCDLDFHGARLSGDFHGVIFSGGTVTFADVVFNGVNFNHAVFSGGIVYFVRTVFANGANFSDARFSGGIVSLIGASFPSGEATFERATFSGSKVFFVQATFSGGAINLQRRSVLQRRSKLRTGAVFRRQHGLRPCNILWSHRRIGQRGVLR